MPASLKSAHDMTAHVERCQSARIEIIFTFLQISAALCNSLLVDWRHATINMNINQQCRLNSIGCNLKHIFSNSAGNHANAPEANFSLSKFYVNFYLIYILLFNSRSIPQQSISVQKLERHIILLLKLTSPQCSERHADDLFTSFLLFSITKVSAPDVALGTCTVIEYLDLWCKYLYLKILYLPPCGKYRTDVSNQFLFVF